MNLTFMQRQNIQIALWTALLENMLLLYYLYTYHAKYMMISIVIFITLIYFILTNGKKGLQLQREKDETK